MTPVHTSSAPVVVSSGGSNESFTSHRSQRFGRVVFGLLVVVLAVVVFKTSNDTVDNLRIVSDHGSITHNLIIAERESLMFVLTFEKWLSGTATRRDLQIRRALLARRLEVPDNTGVSTGKRVHPEYFIVLGVLDDYIKATSPGFLPPDDGTVLRSKTASVLNDFIFETSKLAIPSSAASDEQTRQLILNENSRRTNQYVVLLIVLVLMSLVAGFLEISRLRNYRMVRTQARNERRELEEIRTAVQRAEAALASRLDIERLERADREWIDSEVRSISSRMKGTVAPDKIAEFLVEGLGRTLGADFVVLYLFGKFQDSRLLKQWSRTPATQIDLSQATNYESRLFDLAKRLEERSRVIVVADSRLVDVSRDPFPDLLARSQEVARSWMMTPVGEAIHGLGYVWIGMAENPRVWSSAEVEFTRQVSADAAQVLTHAWMFGQAMRIAENDAEVNRLVELDKAKDDFIEDMNHELRTPLTSIIGYLEMMIEDIDPNVEPVLSSSISAVQRNAIRLQSLIENMMQASMTNFNSVSLVVSTVDVGHLLGDVVKSMKLSAQDSGVEVVLRLDSPAGDLVIDGDVNQLEQVFVNLMSNAIKFTPRGGKVTVIARRAYTGDDCVEVKVADTGIGIPAKEFPNVFKRFFRASTATHASIPGFGIGLSLVESIVRAHHGTITFDSTVGKGTVFTVTLPTRYISTKPSDETR